MPLETALWASACDLSGFGDVGDLGVIGFDAEGPHPEGGALILVGGCLSMSGIGKHQVEDWTLILSLFGSFRARGCAQVTRHLWLRIQLGSSDHNDGRGI